MADTTDDTSRSSNFTHQNILDTNEQSTQIVF
jgi:hypothetical protein